MSKQYTFFKIEVEDWSEDYDYTIVPSMSEALPYLELAASCMDEEDRNTKVVITPIVMTERQYNNFIKKVQP